LAAFVLDQILLSLLSLILLIIEFPSAKSIENPGTRNGVIENFKKQLNCAAR
jgi:hypothetical protein